MPSFACKTLHLSAFWRAPVMHFDVRTRPEISDCCSRRCRGLAASYGLGNMGQSVSPKILRLQSKALTDTCQTKDKIWAVAIARDVAKYPAADVFGNHACCYHCRTFDLAQLKIVDLHNFPSRVQLMQWHIMACCWWRIQGPPKSQCACPWKRLILESHEKDSFLHSI